MGIEFKPSQMSSGLMLHVPSATIANKPAKYICVVPVHAAHNHVIYNQKTKAQGQLASFRLSKCLVHNHGILLIFELWVMLQL